VQIVHAAHETLTAFAPETDLLRYDQVRGPIVAAIDAFCRGECLAEFLQSHTGRQTGVNQLRRPLILSVHRPASTTTKQK